MYVYMIEDLRENNTCNYHHLSTDMPIVCWVDTCKPLDNKKKIAFKSLQVQGVHETVTLTLTRSVSNGKS